MSDIGSRRGVRDEKALARARRQEQARMRQVVFKPSAPSAFGEYRSLGEYVAHAKCYGDVVLLLYNAHDVFNVVRAGAGHTYYLGAVRAERSGAVAAFRRLLAAEEVVYQKIVCSPRWRPQVF